jgi:hypothetical protein
MSNQINLKNFTIRPKFLTYFYLFYFYKLFFESILPVNLNTGEKHLTLHNLGTFMPVNLNTGENYLTSHKGMHSYNGNMANLLKKKFKKFKKKKQQSKLLIAKPFKPFKNKPKPKKRYIKKKVNKSLGVAVNNNQSMKDFKDWYDLVCDPIHTQYPAKIPDPIETETHNFNDFNMIDEEFVLGMSWDDETTPPECDGVVFYMRYGPSEILTTNVFAYSVYAIPVNADGYAIKSTVDGVGLTQIEPTLYVKTWGEIDAARMVSMGFRVNSKVGISTDSTSQFVTKFFAFNMKMSDFEVWLYEEDDVSPLVQMIMTVQDHQEYDNAEGAAARYNPLQSLSQQLAFYQEDNLKNSQDSGYFDTHGMSYPGIYVKFNQPIAVSGFGMLEKNLTKLTKDLFNMDGANDNSRLQHEISRLNRLIPKMKNVKPKRPHAHDKHTPQTRVPRHKRVCRFAALQQQIHDLEAKINDSKIDEFKSESKSEVVEQKVGEIIDITWTFPITIEVKYWLEATILLPSMFIAYPKPIDSNWYSNIAFVTARKDRTTSNGKSFKKIFNTGKKAYKTFNKVRRYAGGMARNIQGVTSDLAPLAEMAMLTL